MRAGTKTYLFGIHQFLLHPIFVIIAWKKLFGSWPGFKVAVCIFLHDIGYIGKKDIETDGETHPELGARIAAKLFGPQWYLFCAGHSRHYAKYLGIPQSDLCAADKLGTLMPPWWVYIPLAVLSGEMKEFRKVAANVPPEVRHRFHVPASATHREWYCYTKAYLQKMAYKIKDGQQVETISSAEYQKSLESEESK